VHRGRLALLAFAPRNPSPRAHTHAIPAEYSQHRKLEAPLCQWQKRSRRCSSHKTPGAESSPERWLMTPPTTPFEKGLPTRRPRGHVTLSHAAPHARGPTRRTILDVRHVSPRRIRRQPLRRAAGAAGAWRGGRSAFPPPLAGPHSTVHPHSAHLRRDVRPPLTFRPLHWGPSPDVAARALTSSTTSGSVSGAQLRPPVVAYGGGINGKKGNGRPKRMGPATASGPTVTTVFCA
jgi:hypothetical protein